ncbi:MAG: cell division protein FtsA [Bacteroidales bacterium]|nr:cell division protein FtsA [Bacteroidales bacterium]
MAEDAKFRATPDDDVDVVVGLDIGTTKVVAVVGQRDSVTGKIKILGYGKTESTGVVRGSVINIERTAEAIKRAVEQASIASNVEINEVYVGIAGQHIQSEVREYTYVRQNSDDVFTREEIERLKVQASHGTVPAGRKIIHVIPRTFSVDDEGGFTEDSIVGMVGANITAMLNIITADAVAMRNIQRSVEMSGLELIGFILEPLVSAEAVLDESDKEAGVVLVDIGGGTTDVAIFMNGILAHTAVIPLAGNIITNDIKTGCTILPKQAEALKVKFGSALPSESSDEQIVSIPGLKGKTAKEISLKQLATIIGARVGEIFSSVSCEIANSQCNLEHFIGGIVLTGGGSKMKHISQVCEFHTQLETRLGMPKEHITPDSPAELSDPIFATAIGLVIYGVRSEEENRIIHVADHGATHIRQPEPQQPVAETPAPPVPEPQPEEEPKARKKGGFTAAAKLRDWVVGIFDDDIQ